VVADDDKRTAQSAAWGVIGTALFGAAITVYAGSKSIPLIYVFGVPGCVALYLCLAAAFGRWPVVRGGGRRAVEPSPATSVAGNGIGPSLPVGGIPDSAAVPLDRPSEPSAEPPAEDDDQLASTLLTDPQIADRETDSAQLLTVKEVRPRDPETKPVRIGSITTLVLPNLAQLTKAPSGSRSASADDVMASLLADQELQRETYNNLPAPRLILLPGGLTRSGTVAEYGAASRFLTGVRTALGLTPDRVLITPGANDLNASLYQQYLRDCRTAAQPPQSPYWPKWTPFLAMLDDLYQGPDHPGSLSGGQPWTWWENAAAHTAVAVLNSTVRDTGRFDRRGHLGHEQIDFFADRVAARRAQGWLCIGVVYDSPLFDSEPGLDDADVFLERVAANLHVVVHGRSRPRSERLQYLGSTPVLAPSEDRAGGYQILDLGTSPRVWGRVYDPRRGDWKGDLELGDDPRVWWRTLPL
jgi:hypothetical protein